MCIRDRYKEADSKFAAMLEEAEKYLGYPYVWGGSDFPVQVSDIRLGLSLIHI